MKQFTLMLAFLAFSCVVFAQPPNDAPCGAIALNVEEGASCVPAIPYEWTGATNSMVLPLPDCGDFSGDDVWFTFELTENSSLYITTATFTLPYDGAMALYQADACNEAFTLITCDDDSGPGVMPQISLLNTLPGTYYVRFWEYGGGAAGNIGICVAVDEPVVWPEPANDEPCDATVLEVQQGITCTPDTPILWSGATDTPGFPDPPCGSYNGADVWFTFQLFEDAALYITTETAIPYNGVMALYRANTCDGTYEYLTCDDNSGTGLMPRIQLFDVPPGTYYIRFWESTGNTSGNFGICVAVSEPIQGPENDTPCDAIDLLVETGTSCVPDLPLSWTAATAAPGVPNPACVPAFTLNSGDIWFRFELSETHYGLYIDAIGSADGVMELFAADACDGTFVSLACDDDSGLGNDPRILMSELSAGVYYIRFWFWGNGPASITASLTGICVSGVTDTDLPDNNAPCSALQLEVQNGLYCQPANPLSWENASNSMVLPSTICGSQNARDVWFYFEVDALSNVRVETLQGSGTGAMNDGVMELYRGDDCSDLERIGCDDDSGLNLMPELYMQLEPGRYYIRFWSFNGAPSGNIGGICVTASEPGPVPNDFCEGAIAFPEILLNGDCASVYANNSQATGGSPSFFAGTPSPDGDLWYRFTVPGDETQLYFEFESITGHVLRRLTLHPECTAVNMGAAHLFIAAQESGEGLITGLAPGETYILRVFLPDLNSYSEFNLCLRVTPEPPANDECIGAIAFPEIPADGSCVGVTVEPRWATYSPTQACNGTGTPDVWYSFVVPEGVTNLIAQVNPVNLQGAIDGTYAVYEGNCGSLTPIYCSDDNAPQIYGLTPGETYYIRAHTSDDDRGRFELCLRAAPPIPINDECHSAIPFPQIPNDGTCAVLNINPKGATGPANSDCSFVFNPDQVVNAWYTFVVPAGHDRLIFKQQPIGGPFSGIVVYTVYGGSCDNLQQVACGGGTLSGEIIDGLMGGQTYHLEVITGVSLWNDTGVDLCIRTLPPSPAEDLCEDAVDFPNLALDGSWTSMNLSTLAATGAENDILCGSFIGNDIWVRVLVPAGFDQLRYRLSSVTNGRVNMALYEDDCQELEWIDCMDLNIRMVTPVLQGGTTYLIRIYDDSEGGWANLTLELAVPFEPLLNEACADALPFPAIPLNGDCSTVVGENFQASVTVDDTCDGFTVTGNTRSVWYFFQVPADVTALELDLLNYYGWRPNVQIYEGNCAELVPVRCIISYPRLLSGLTPGGLYFMRVFTTGTGTSSGFELCLSTVNTPPNDECEQAISITGQPGEYVDPGLQTTQGATVSPQDRCGNYFTEPYDVWYSFETGAEGGDLEITAINVQDEFGGNFSLIVQVLEGTCDGLVSLGCLSAVNQNNVDNTTTVNLTGLLPLTTYYIRVFIFGPGMTWSTFFNIYAQGSALTPVATNEVPRPEALRIDRVFPVPTDDRVLVHFRSAVNAPVQYQVFNALGNLVLQGQEGGFAGSNTLQFSLANLPSGMYFLSLQQNGLVAPPQKIIKQ